MSRGEELRAKFKAKGQAIADEMNSPLGIFNSKISAFARNVCSAKASRAFIEIMFAKSTADAPADLDAWLAREVQPLFRCMSQKPVWVNEPDWCCHDGMPMEFMHQFADEHGVAFYVFRGEHAFTTGNGISGKTELYKMCAQDREGTIVFKDTFISCF